MKISSCQTRYSETEIESSSDGFITEEQSTEEEEMSLEKLNAARRSVGSRLRKVEQQCSMSRVDLDTALRGVETIE